MQALHLLAVDPVVETKADRNSYGFRQQRSCADAIEQCFLALRTGSAQWILEGDIQSCFDKISHAGGYWITSPWTRPFCASGGLRDVWRSTSFTKPRRELRRAASPPRRWPITRWMGWSTFFGRNTQRKRRSRPRVPSPCLESQSQLFQERARSQILFPRGVVVDLQVPVIAVARQGWPERERVANRRRRRTTPRFTLAFRFACCRRWKRVRDVDIAECCHLSEDRGS
jgi:hypothetical protein